MAKCIWRRHPSKRLYSFNLFKKKSSENAFNIGNLFFEVSGSPPAYFGVLKRWTGSLWIKEPLKTYLSGSWQSRPLKRFDGSAWKTVDTTGI